LDSPSNTLRKLAARLWPGADPRQAFLDALQTPPTYHPGLIWLRPRPEPALFQAAPRQPWQPEFVDCVSIDQRPGQQPAHERGDYYCLDMSSVFAACVLLEVPPRPAVVVDLCAAPGGKSVFARRALEPGLLLANEVIKKRTAPLIANFQRCRIAPAAVLTADSSLLAAAAPQSAQLVIVDAPCSGQSLIARGKPSPGCFHPATINLNANRQRRILGNAARLIAPGGYLAYLTCTYADKENERNTAWLLKHHPELQPVPVPRLEAFQSHLADFPCYRLWPQQRIGAGAYAVLLRSPSGGEPRPVCLDDLRPVWKSLGHVR
jgi:16S rRNA C967 or C1407 C5-methylase (RsmB/RsmF family)